MSYVADSKGGGGSKRPSLAESLVDINAATSPTKSLEAVAADLINQCDKVGGDRVAPGLRHRLEQVPAILQELRGALSEHRDDWRVQRALASLRQALAQTRSTLQRAQAAWFRRRSRFRDPLRSHIDDLNDAFARLRVAAVQVRARPIAPMPTTPLDEKSDPAVACDAIGSAESTCLLADKHLFGHGVPNCLATAKRMYEEAAVMGYAPAMDSLGRMYRDGIGMASRDTARALEWFTRAAALGSIDAVNCLAELQMELGTQPGDVSHAVELFEMAASADHVEAITSLGWLHEHGSAFGVVEKDLEVAEQWYRIAASMHFAKAQNNLGYLLYCRSIGETDDSDLEEGRARRRLEEAIALFRLSADQGNASALNNLGICTESGRGVSQDPVEARHLYLQSAQLGNAHACVNLARCLMNGLQFQQARHWLRRALDTGNDSAKGVAHAMLGSMYEAGSDMGVQKCMVTAREHYEAAAKLGNARGQYLTGRLAACPPDIFTSAPDMRRAFDLYKSSALQGCADGQNAFGELLEEGVPAVQDFSQAMYWYKKAAEQNHPGALFNLACLYENGAGVPVDKTLSLHYLKRAADCGNLAASSRLLDMQS
ncbi:Sel1 repeat [Plasmodiophora brassicae]|nr:hypothetical protein PBRA_004257 [Plasmodiophora brassicae]